MRGDPAAELDTLLRRRHDADRVVLYGSGTQALTAAISAALRAAGGDTVALPAYNCFDVATAALGAGARIAFYDVDPASLTPDEESFERAIRSGACAAVAASLYGFPLPWDELEGVADTHGVLLIEDAAQGLGGSYKGRPLGSFGDLGILSFGRGKGWTGGGGGALLHRTIGHAAASPAPSGAFHSVHAGLLAIAQWLLSDPRLYSIPASLPWLHLGETRYHPPMRPRALASFSAALLIETAEAALRETEVRRRTGHALTDALRGRWQLQFPQAIDGGEAGYLRLPIRVADPSVRDLLLHALGRLGAAAGYPLVLSRLPEVAAAVRNLSQSYPGAQTLTTELITLPTHSRAPGSLAHDVLTLLG